MGKTGRRGRARNRAKRPAANVRAVMQRHNPISNRQRMRNDPPPLKTCGFESFKVHFLVGLSPTSKIENYGILTDPGVITLIGNGVQLGFSFSDVRKAVLCQKFGLIATSAMQLDLSLTTVKFWGNENASMVELGRSIAPNQTYPSDYVRDVGAKNSRPKCKVTYPPTYFVRSLPTGGTEGAFSMGAVGPTVNPPAQNGLGTLVISGLVRKITSISAVASTSQNPAPSVESG